MEQRNPCRPDVDVAGFVPLRQEAETIKVDDSDSLRGISSSVGGKSSLIGKQISNVVERYFDKYPQLKDDLVKNFGKPFKEVAALARLIDCVRHEVASLSALLKR